MGIVITSANLFILFFVGLSCWGFSSIFRHIVIIQNGEFITSFAVIIFYLPVSHIFPHVSLSASLFVRWALPVCPGSSRTQRLMWSTSVTPVTETTGKCHFTWHPSPLLVNQWVKVHHLHSPTPLKRVDGLMQDDVTCITPPHSKGWMG